MQSENMTASKKIVSGLMASDPSIQKSRFAAALRSLSDSKILSELAATILPDAYSISDDEVVLYEVSDTNPIRAEKAARISVLADEMDEIERLLRVVVLDYTGHVVANTPGWAYGPSHTADFASAACMDMTPAARAAYRRNRITP